ncbi:type IV pilus modification protein PilV [Halopseudomonas pelagia]|uniref:type IV pilus modification protein PilV n=1 Tax=Halopseudomonas pelagia TaxID=553151 RepID=UPI0003A1C5FC|nr:type IV pilus modification protein PilV [Halopseudomonas pelagia]
MLKPVNSAPKGFSLLEVLITILLIAVGVLGMVAMQGRSIQYTNDSLHRTQAAILANEMIEIVRASPTTATTGDAFYFSAELPSSTGDCREIGAASLMDDQIACWGDKVRRLLPDAGSDAVSGQFYVCRTAVAGTCGAGAAVEVQVAWRAAGEQCLIDGDADADICTYRVRTQI